MSPARRSGSNGAPAGLEGLRARAREFSLDSEDVQRAVTPLICLTSDMEDEMKREGCLDISRLCR